MVLLPGYQQLAEWSAEQVRKAGGRIELGKAVKGVVQDQQTSSIHVETDAGRFEAGHVISSLPLGVMQHSPPSFSPALPEATRTALSNLGVGLLNKIILRYDSAWWRSLKLPSVFSLLPTHSATRKQGYRLPQEDVPHSMVQAQWLVLHGGLFVQNYDLTNGSPILLCFLGPPTGNAVEMLEEAWVVDSIHKRIVETIVPKDTQAGIPTPTTYVVTRWNSDPLSHGSYSYVPAAYPERKIHGGSQRDMEIAGQPVWDGALGFCGEHTHPDCFASVHGALLTGEREADRVLTLLDVAKE